MSPLKTGARQYEPYTEGLLELWWRKPSTSLPSKEVEWGQEPSQTEYPKPNKDEDEWFDVRKD